jgi:hypothetical protein
VISHSRLPKQLLLVLLLWQAGLRVTSAQAYILSGSVRDGSTNETLPFANISVKGESFGTVTDAAGLFRLPLKTGSYDLLISFIGYKTETRSILIDARDRTLHVKLFQTDILLQEVTVFSGATEQSS